MRTKISFQRSVISGVFTTLSLMALVLTVGCSSNTDGGDSNDPQLGQDVFTSDDVGGITVKVTDTTIEVSQTTTFSAEVRDGSGAPVENIRVSCDSESGVAIIEPSQGFFTTNSFGNASGVIGCETPGSFLFGCRLPIGANKREFVQIKCEGAVPQGFTGFPGAAGGGIGGGVVVSDDGTPGGTGVDGLTIESITFNTGTEEQSTSIDTTQVNCEEDPAEPADCEPFFDDRVVFTLRNRTNQTFILDRYNYTVPSADGAGTSFTSKNVSLNSQVLTGNGGTATVEVLFTEARTPAGASTCGLRKRFLDSSSVIPSDLGVRNISFRVTATNEVGDTTSLRFTGSASFDNFDNCG